MQHSLIFSLFVIFTGAAMLATLALYARQALPVAYIVLGVAIGSSGAGWLADPVVVSQLSEVGIIFLLFLLGLDLAPRELLHMLRKATLVTLASSAGFALIGAGVAMMAGFSPGSAALIGAAVTFSSTIIGLKLLPTTALHHQHTGEVIISILLLQDLLAIGLLVFLKGFAGEGGWAERLVLLVTGLPVLLALTFLVERYLLIRLIRRFNKIREYIFLMAIGWCLGVAEAATLFGLSHEIGAFIAGVSLATNPIALYIADSLKPLRDFFLVLFFVSLGAGVDLSVVLEVLMPALVLAALLLLVKPMFFQGLLRLTGEPPGLAMEVGVRLGQVSEFALLIAVLAMDNGVLAPRGAYLIQTTAVLTFVVSTYWIVLRYPTPVAVSDRLRRD